LYHY